MTAGEVILNLLRQYLSIESAQIIMLREDDAVGNATARMKPVMVEAPDSPFSIDLKKVAARLCQSTRSHSA